MKEPASIKQPPLLRLSSFLTSKARGRLSRPLERVLYKYKVPIPNARLVNRKLLKIGVLHPEVFSPAFPEFLKAQFPTDYARIIERANNACNLVFDLLGSGPVDLNSVKARPDLRFYLRRGRDTIWTPGHVGGKVPWHFDFKAGIGWDPRTFFTDIRYGDAVGIDVKIPWELSRGHHLVTLGQAYQLTKTERYAECLCDLILDWIRQNPPKFGVNWSSPMEVAIRASNWLVAWQLVEKSTSVPRGFESQLIQSLWEHGCHLWRHLEWGRRLSTNHLIANLAGLGFFWASHSAGKSGLY